MASALPVPRVKVICLLVARNRVLLAQAAERPHGPELLVPPGGGLEFGETLEAGVRRVVREALGCGIDELRCVGFSENLFRWRDAPRHELVFLFAGRPDEDRLIEPESIDMADGERTRPARWYDLVDLSETGLPVVPNGAFDHIRVLIGGSVVA